MPTLHVEFDPSGEPPVGFAGDTTPLVYFLSFAFAGRYGAQHELTKASLLLRGGEHTIDLRPLLTFADRDVEEEADRRELERVWQEAGPLAVCCRRVVEAIDGDIAIREELREFPTLRDRIEELGRIACWAAEHGVRIRLTYGDAGRDSIYAGPGEDVVSGGDGADRIRAGPGDDTISGDGGNDVINCGTGTDIADGGPGADLAWPNCETQTNIP